MIKLYYNISTTAFIGKVADPVGEVWTQGDDGSKELRIYFGTGTTASFTNGLTSSTIYDYNCRVYATRPGETTAGSLSATAVVSGSDIYYKIVADSWITGVEGNVTLNTQRYTASVTIAYGAATQAVGAGTPGVESTYALATDLATLESSVNDINAAKYEKSGLVGTTAEIAAGIATGQEVYTADKTDELLAANSVTDQAYTDTEVGKVVSGTYTAAKATADDDGNDIVDTYQTIANKVTSFQATPDDTHYPSEKLVADTFTPMTRTILDIDLTDDIELAEFKTALGEATTSLSGLLSAEDKTRLDALYAIFNETADGSADSIVDNLTEILAIFDQYPEGADLVTALAAKEDKSNKKTTLTDNSDTYYPSQKAVKTAVDAKVDKALSTYTAVAASSVADADLARVYLDNNGAARVMTLTEIYAGANAATGAFVAGSDYSGDGLAAYKSAFEFIHAVAGSSGQYKVNVKDIGDGLYANVLMPDTSADTTLTTQLSFDDGTTYRYLQINGEDIPVADLSGKILHLYRSGTALILENIDEVEHAITHIASVASTYGIVNPMPGGSPSVDLVKGLTLYQPVENGDGSNGTTGWGAYYGSLTNPSGNIIATGNGGAISLQCYQANVLSMAIGDKIYIQARARTLDSATALALNTETATANIAMQTQTNPVTNTWYIFSGVVTATIAASILINIRSAYADTATQNGSRIEVDYCIAVPLTNTPLSSYTAAQVSALLTTYWEGYKDITDFTVKTVGKNLCDVNASYEVGTIDTATGADSDSSTRLRSAFYIPIKSSTDYQISASTNYNYFSAVITYDKDYNFIASNSTQFTSQANARYVRFSLRRSDSATITVGEIHDALPQLEEGTTATTYQAYRDETLKLYGTLRSVGSVQDEVKKVDNVWSKETKVAVDTTVVKAATSWSSTTELTNTIRFYKDLSSLGYKIPSTTSTVPNIALKIATSIFKTINYTASDSSDEELVSINTSNNTLNIRILKSKLGGTTSGDLEAYLQANDVTFYYELATPTTAEIEYDGTTLQDVNTTVIQESNNATSVTITYALNEAAQIPVMLERLAMLQDKIDENEVDIATNATDISALETAVGTIGDLDTTATDLVEAVNEVKTTADAAKTKTDYLTVTGAADVDKMAEWTTLWSTGLTVPTADPGSANITLSAADTGFTFIVFEYYIDTTNSAQERMGLVWVPSDGTNGIKNTRFSQRALITTEYHAYILRNSSTTYRAYGATLWTYTVDSPASISTADSTEIKLTKIYGVKL